MDRITKSYIDAFRAEQSLSEDLDEPTAFEFFADYCAISDLYDEEFDVVDVHVGGEGDLGFDGIAIIVNGALVQSIEEAEDLLELNGYLDVKFAFVQAKTSSGFSGEQIAAFLDGVDEFFEEAPTLPMSEQVQAFHGIMTWIYKNSVKFRRQKPSVDMAFITTGQWKEDVYLLAKIAKRIDRLKETGLFGEIALKPYGADELHDSYQRSKNSVLAEFTFANKVLLADIEGVSESYLGVVPATDFLPLIVDSVGNIRKSLFYDNIRDFQDYNAVNQDIQSTIRDAASQRRFAILNNGVTVVARSLRTTGNKFAITDYQIVNGCQTSHVLFDERDNLTEDVQVPLRVIATSDEDIINSIITATNRQTQVTTEDLYALSGFQKRLEALYDSYPGKKKLFYERRSKQYSAAAGVEKVRIISKPQQIRAFAAMFLDDPHRASRYYSDLRGQVGTKIFNEQHKLEPYYAAAYGYYKLEYLFRNGALPVYYKPARYHLLMALRYTVAGAGMPALTANKMQSYSNKLSEVLWSDEKATEAFKKGIEAIEAAVGADVVLTRDSVKTQAFTDAVKSALGVAKVGVAPSAP